MILVTGANGHLGSQTINFLLDNNPDTKIAGLVRGREKGAELEAKDLEIRIGDYNDYSSVEEALDGIDTLLLISASSLEDRVEQHKNVIDAAQENGIDQIFYTSLLKADQKLSPLSEDHAKTEELIKDSGISYSIFRHTFYTELLPLFLGDALETEQWRFPSDGHKINLAMRTEMAEALANALMNPQKHKNEIYEITSGQAYSLPEITHMINDNSGNMITYSDVSVSKFEEGLKQADLPEDQQAMTMMGASTFANGGLNFTYDHLEQLLRREPTGTKDFIKDFFA